jgi:hypothetical protein
MKTHTKLFATVLIALGFLAAPVMAQLPSFDELDQDGNGYISASEAAVLPCLADNFHRIETESTEGLNRREFNQAISEYCHGSDPA